MRKTLLVIGDPMMTSERFEKSLDRFFYHKQLLQSRGVECIFVTYQDITCLRLPVVSTRKIDTLLFFPYNHWNSYIERYDRDNRIYGDNSFGRDFRLYLDKIDRIIRKRYIDKDLSFINPPGACIVDRDKLQTSNILKQAGIKTPDILKVHSVKDFRYLLARHGSLYIKPRFGAMGKGITFADQSGVYTNFSFKSKKITNRAYDYNWRPLRVAAKNSGIFIEQLINKGFIFQRAIEPLVYKNRRFDIRVYTAYGKTPYLYAKSAPQKSFITNWSQGGRIEKKAFLGKALSSQEIKKIKSISLAAAKAIGLLFSGVDVIIDRHTRQINALEIQSFPGYERGFDLMGFLARHI
jgi:glutathione synthase/RimK-type ligase-like ATP-grasp enzyme